MARLPAALRLLTVAALLLAAGSDLRAQPPAFGRLGSSQPANLAAAGGPVYTAFRPPVDDDAFFDFDTYVQEHPPTDDGIAFEHGIPGHEDFQQPWSWQILPDGLIYRSYLAGPKESRMAAHIVNNKNDSRLWNATLGARVGLLRYGTRDRFRPEGFEIDVEGSAQVRLDIPEEVDVRSTDYRVGVPITYGWGPHAVKFAYYHLSSHLGDEFLIKNSGFTRLNYSRDVLVLGYSYYALNNLRLYGEAGWAFYDDVAEQWEFQFGLDWAPTAPTGICGAPFFAINAMLREEVNFGGGLTVHTGWAWRGDQHGRLLRIGLHYYNGESTQFSFFDVFEEHFGVGVWYDF